MNILEQDGRRIITVNCCLCGREFPMPDFNNETGLWGCSRCALKLRVKACVKRLLRWKR